MGSGYGVPEFPDFTDHYLLEGTTMQLLMAIVQAEDADILIDRLVEKGHRVTRINSVGSFLMRGNATILIGVENDGVEPILSTIRTICRTRSEYMNMAPPAEAMAGSLAAVVPVEVLVGGAIVFQFPVKRFLRLLGGSAPPVADQQHPAIHAAADELAGGEGGQMHLVLAILQNDDADSVAGGLLAAGHRLTRLNTAGGFLRRGNVTLLIGVEADRVDNVLQIIQANCRLRTEARSPEAGMPMYSATVFVLEAARFDRL
jgi:uncharacterized protein YaaQ